MVFSSIFALVSQDEREGQDAREEKLSAFTFLDLFLFLPVPFFTALANSFKRRDSTAAAMFVMLAVGLMLIAGGILIPIYWF